MPYSGNPGASPADEVRFLLGDTGASPRLSDQEIAWLLSTYGTPLQAAYHGAVRLVAIYSGKSSKTVGPTSIEYTSLVDQFKGVMTMLEKLGASAGPKPIPSAGGLDDPMWSDVDWSATGHIA